MFESIDDLPVANFSALNKYMMIDGGIGSDFDDIDRIHLTTLYKVADNPEKLRKELQNFRQLIFNLCAGVNIRGLAFACLIHSVNGEQMTDLSDSTLKEIMQRLSDAGLTEADVKKNFTKQKIDYSWNLTTTSPPSSPKDAKTPTTQN
jgi:hypothetical protein